MTELTPGKPKRPSDVFRSDAVPSMEDVRCRAGTSLEGRNREDTLSAFRRAGEALRIDWAAVPATPNRVRTLLTARSASELGFTESRWANIRSLINGAVKRFGPSRRDLSANVPLSTSWEDLIKAVPGRHHRDGVRKLGRYCSAMQIAPDSVTGEVLRQFYDALCAEELTGDPRRKLKHTIAIWNICQKSTPGWPDFKLGSPFERDTYAVSLGDLPTSAQADIAAWRARLLTPDPFDPTAPRYALEAVSVDGMQALLLRVMGAMVAQGAIEGDQITDLKTVVEDIVRVKAALRFLLDRNGDKTSDNVAKHCAAIVRVAEHYCHLPAEHIKALKQMHHRLTPPRPSGMRASNREKLRPFDDPKNVRKLLAFPAEEATRGRRNKNAYRATKCFERAVACALLIEVCLRGASLRTLQISTDLTWNGARCYLSIPAERVKNDQALDFELSLETSALLKEYLITYRPRLPGSEGDYLFPNGNGGPRSHGALFTSLMDRIYKMTGLTVNPHLFRHIIAKIVIEEDPGLAFALSRHLGHKSMNTTMGAYLGTEGRAVSRKIDGALRAVRTKTGGPNAGAS